MQTGDTGHVTPAEWRWVIVFSIIMVLVAFLPFVWVLAIGLAGSHWQFMGVLHDYNDGATLLARIYQGTQDHWLTLFLHTPEPQDGTFIHVVYTLLGQLSRFIALPPVALFHAARVGAALFMYLTLYQLAAKIWMRVRTRRIFFMLVVVGSGFGWVIAPIFDVTTPDLTVPQVYPFFSTLANVHYPLTIACLALLASVIVLIFRPGTIDPPSVENGGALVFVSGLILVAVYPLAFVPLIVALFLGLAAIRRQHRANFGHKLRWLLWFVVPALPMLSYYVAVIVYNDTVNRVWEQMTADPVPSPIALALGLGLPLLIALPGLYRAVRRFEPDGDQYMLLWLAVMVALIYLPLGVEMQFAAGIMIPIAYFATRSVEDFWFDFVPRRWRLHLALLVLPVIALSHIFMMAVPLRPMAAGDFSKASRLLLDRDYFEVFDVLDNRVGSNDIVLAAPEVSLWLPAWTGARVVYGHPEETIDAQRKERAVLEWYSAQDIDDCHAVLDGEIAYKGTFQVDYVLVGPMERALGPTVCTDLLTPLAEINSVVIYRYLPADDSGEDQ